LNGLGYDVCIPTTTAEKLPAPGATVRLQTHVVIRREDSQTLYGFATAAERDFFRLLIEKVTGVGPKMALSVMSIALTRPVLGRRHCRRRCGHPGEMPGIGKKTAETTGG